MALICTDDVLIVGVERDYDCLCLGEDKATKQKRLLKGKDERKGPKSGKSHSDSQEVKVNTCTEESSASTTKTISTQSSRLETHNEAENEQSTNTTMQQFPRQPVAGSVYPQRGAALSSVARGAQPAAPTIAFKGVNGGTSANSYGMVPAQQDGAVASTSQDINLDCISSSEWDPEWDTLLDQISSANADRTDTCTQLVPTINQCTNGNMTSKGTSNSSNSNSSTLATSSTAQYGSPAGASGTSTSGSINQTSQSGTASNSRPAVQSQSSSCVGSANNYFADTTTEKDSATQQSASLCNSTQNNSALFSSTGNYPSCSNAAAIATPNTAPNQQNLSLQQPINNTFQKSQHLQLQHQNQQGYSTSMATSQLPNYQAPPTTGTCTPAPIPPQYSVSNPGSVQGQHHHQQGYHPSASATTLSNSQLQSPMNQNSNNATTLFFHPSPNGHHHASMAPHAQQASQLQQQSCGTINPRQQQHAQLPFNTGAGAISTPSNSLLTYGGVTGLAMGGGPGRTPPGLQQPSFDGRHPPPLGPAASASSSSSSSSSSCAGTEHLQNDEVLARKLQEDEYIKGMRRSKHGDERLAMSLLANDLSIGQARNSVAVSTGNAQLQYPLQQQQQQQFFPPSAMQVGAGGVPSNFSTNTNEQPNGAVLSNAGKILGEEKQEQGPGPGGNSTMMKHPTCWAQCPNCPSEVTRKYHLIDVERGSPEWNVVSQPLFNSGFCVEQVQRIQNETLWQRLCFEKQLMLRDRPSCNEKFLYHTSRAKVAVICEEGLDPRLSRNGLFGSGIYFSDNPIKCDKYWSNKLDSERTMFCCRVLLGDTKVYPRGKSEQLKREPPKENPQPGEPKTYDSVKGNVSGQDEFVVYNAYRVMPEYVIKYSSSEAEAFTMRSRLVCMRQRQIHARRVSTQLPYPNPHSMFHSVAPPACLQLQPSVPSMAFIGGPSNNNCYNNPMAVADSARFGASPMVMAPQPCFGGVQPPMFQSPTPMPHFPTRST